MQVRRKVNIDEIPVDKQLRKEDGWVRMQVQWLCSEEVTGSKQCVVGRTIFPPGGAAHELHTHSNAEEVLYVIRGEGIAISGDEEFKIGPGDLVYVPAGDVHYFKNTHPTEEMETLWMYGGAPSLEKSGYNHVKQ